LIFERSSYLFFCMPFGIRQSLHIMNSFECLGELENIF